MSKVDVAFWGYAVGTVVTFVMLLVMYQGTTANKLDTEAHEAKVECEAHLPRNQSCEVVVTAKIKEIKEN